MKHPCVFGDEFIRKEVDPRIKQVYEAHGKKANFGDLRRTWRQMHCAQVAPYGPCPYARQDCAMAFLHAASKVVFADRPGAMFRTVAKRSGLERAEASSWSDRRVARSSAQARPIPVLAEDGPASDLQSGTADDYAEDVRYQVRGTNARPTRIGEMLGAQHARPHKRPDHIREEGAR